MAILNPAQNRIIAQGLKMNLSQAQLGALVTLAQLGDEVAKSKLAVSQAPLCARIAHKWGADAQEVFQLTMVGVIDAINTYSPQGGASFTTWTVNKIRGEITNFHRTKNQLAVPENRKLEILRIVKEADKKGIDPLDMLNDAQAYDWECMRTAPTRLSAPLGEKGSVEDTLAEAPAEGVAPEDLEVLAKLLDTLSEEDRAFVLECASTSAIEASAKAGLGRETGRKKYTGAISKMAQKWEAWARA